eukprot:Gb_11971 [translate_table: standard]
MVEFKPSPVVARFSSRGPNKISENILKPDVAASAVNVLAVWALSNPLSDPPPGEKSCSYVTISGTSMSCPHVSGAAAFLKSINPTWSVFAIKSALMTTAITINNDNKHIRDDTGYIAREFDMGTEEINHLKALEPGLVYPKDHFLFLCYSRYNQTQIGSMIGDKSFVFPTDSKPELISSFNYPSISIAQLNGSKTVARTLTNVGTVDLVYKVALVSPQGVEVKVSSDELLFSATQKSIAINECETQGDSYRCEHILDAWIFSSCKP